MDKEVYVFTQNQKEYWAREFAFRTIKISNDSLLRLHDLVNLGHSPIVEVAEISDKFENFPPNSLIALLDADEKFDLQLNEFILDSKVFKGIIRQYRIPCDSSCEFLKVFIFGLFQSMKIVESQIFRRTAGWLLAGLGMRSRQMKISRKIVDSHKILIEIPLGYTDYFAETFLQIISQSDAIKFNRDGSLLNIATSVGMNSAKNRSFKFVFIGQVGQIVRRHAIEALKKFEPKILILRDGYGGVSNDENRFLRIGEEYVSGLTESKISVCPPGNISGNSYRIMESLICGAYPAVMGKVLCDPLFESPVIEVITNKKPRTWTAYLKKLELVTDEQLQACVMENITKFKSEIEEAKTKLIALQHRS
jgi:hypothetical protein